MFPSVRRSTAVLVSTILVVAAACGQHSANAPSPASRIGIYRFSERPNEIKEALEGRIVVTSDSVWVVAEPGPCNYDATSASTNAIVYRCADITYAFDRRDPLNRSTYRYVGTVQQNQKNCARYAVGSQARQNCIDTQSSTADRQVTVSGTLHFTAIAKAG